MTFADSFVAPTMSLECEERGAAFAREMRELSRRHESRRRRIMQRRFAHAVYKRELADQTEEHSYADDGGGVTDVTARAPTCRESTRRIERRVL